MRLATRAKAAIVTGIAVLSIALGAPNASADEATYVPDPGMWCHEWAEANSNEIVGVTVNFLGVVGSSAQNDAKCKMVYVYGVSEGNAKTGWYGYNGVMPPGYLNVDWDGACRQQYPGTHVKWFDPMSPPLTNIPVANDLAARGYTWQCVN